MDKWVKNWQKAGKELDKIHKKELRDFDYKSNIQVIDSLLQYACEHATPRFTSGLVEQQRLFMKFRKKII